MHNGHPVRPLEQVSKCAIGSKLDSRIEFSRTVEPMTEQGETNRFSLLHSAMEELLDGTRAVAHLLGRVRGGAVGAVPESVAAPVTRMLESLEQLVELAPPFFASSMSSPRNYTPSV